MVELFQPQRIIEINLYLKAESLRCKDICSPPDSTSGISLGLGPNRRMMSPRQDASSWKLNWLKHNCMTESEHVETMGRNAPVLAQ